MIRLAAILLMIPALVFGQTPLGNACLNATGQQIPCAVTPTVATNGWSADLTNALTAMAVIVLPVVGGMIVQALRKLAAKWDLEGTAQNTANTEADIRTALNVGITQVMPVIEKTGWNSAETHEAIIATATEYLRQRFPDRAAAITAAGQPPTGSTAPNVPSSVAIGQTLAARLPDAVATAAASPATPPAPAPTV